VHLVYIEEIVPGRIPELDEVNENVARDWQVVRRAEAEKEILEALRAKYTITIEVPSPEGS